MPNISEMKQSRFLKRSDVGDGVTVTIVGVELTNVALESALRDDKWCASLREFPGKLMVLNGTNQRMIAKVLGSEETDDWIGRKVILWDDESVEFKGQVVGGIRVKRVPASGGKPAVEMQRLTRADIQTVRAEDLVSGAADDDDIPF